MFRIDSTTAVGTLPAVQPAGTPGFFMQIGGGASGTLTTPDWANGIQEELISILSAAGVAPAKGTNNQVLTSLRALFGQNYTIAQLQALFAPFGIENRKLVFTGNGAIVFPTGITEVMLTMCGGGGGGGGSAGPSGSYTGAGGGGGGADSVFNTAAVTAGQTYIITIGGAGAAGAGGAGGNGGSTSFGSVVTCGGGYGGAYGLALASSGAGGAAGGAGGTSGAAGFSVPGGADFGFSGMGGFSIMGQGGSSTLNGPGGLAQGYGSGGAGGSNGNAGAAGQPGIIIVEW